MSTARNCDTNQMDAQRTIIANYHCSIVHHVSIIKTCMFIDCVNNTKNNKDISPFNKLLVLNEYKTKEETGDNT